MRLTIARSTEGGGIAFLVKRFPRLSETFVLNEFLELRRQGVPVKLFALMDPGERHVQPEAAALRTEVTYLRGRSWLALAPKIVRAAVGHPVGTLRAMRLVRLRSSTAWRHLGEALVLISHLERRGQHHVHAHFAHSPAAVAHMAHAVRGVPFSFTTHAKDLYTTPPEDVRSRSEVASFVVTCTEANRNHLVDIIGVDAAKVLVAPHGVDVGRFRTILRQPVAGRVISVGRLVPKKGFDVLMHACAELDRMGVPYECTIYGDGPEHGGLEVLVKELGLGSRVCFSGERTHTELLDEYGRAEVFTLASVVSDDGDRDGLPNVLLEAMAAGVAVVATDISGIPELIVDGVNGRLVPSGDPEALAMSLAAVLRDDKERARLARCGQAQVCEEFDLTARVRPLAAAFSGCVGRTGGVAV